MVPFIVFVVVAGLGFIVLVIARRGRGSPPLAIRELGQRSLAFGLAAMFGIAAAGHFVEPLRAGLIATVPPLVPFPDLVVTATGIVEVVFAVALVVPASRRLAAWAVVAYLIAVFPANVLAATVVEHPDAPSTPLVLRAAIQVVFVGAALVVARFGEGVTVRELWEGLRSRSARAPWMRGRRNRHIDERELVGTPPGT